MQEQSVYSSSGSEEDEGLALRGNVEQWCTCNNCTDMASHREKVCCDDMQSCSEKKDDATVYYGKDSSFECICDHPGFRLVCLRWEVLELAWNQYKRQYGREAYNNHNRYKRYRHVAYRQLASFLFGSVGRNNRYILPSCAVNKIRETFPNDNGEEYTGFQYE